MSSLAARLQKVQMPASEMHPDLSHLSLDQLRNEKLTFGKTHQGKSFQHLWDNQQSWISWFVHRFSGSTKAEHLILLRYVELEVERAELSGKQVPVINLTEMEKVMELTGGSSTQTGPQVGTLPPATDCGRANSMGCGGGSGVVRSHPTGDGSIPIASSHSSRRSNAGLGEFAIMQHLENLSSTCPTAQ
eukprot:s2344_g5.t1